MRFQSCTFAPVHRVMIVKGSVFCWTTPDGRGQRAYRGQFVGPSARRAGLRIESATDLGRPGARARGDLACQAAARVAPPVMPPSFRHLARTYDPYTNLTGDHVCEYQPSSRVMSAGEPTHNCRATRTRIGQQVANDTQRMLVQRRARLPCRWPSQLGNSAPAPLPHKQLAT